MSTGGEMLALVLFNFLLNFVTLYKYFKAFFASGRALLHKLCINITIASILLPLKIFAWLEIGFCHISQKVSALRHKLLHKLYINVAIANISLHW
jgi:hypothetical protein